MCQNFCSDEIFYVWAFDCSLRSFYPHLHYLSLSPSLLSLLLSPTPSLSSLSLFLRHYLPHPHSLFLSFHLSPSFSLKSYLTEREPPHVVPYLSPIVLRKEVESLLSLDGPDALGQDELLTDKPIIYWNLVWYLSRLYLPTCLPLLKLGALTKTRPDLKKVRARCTCTSEQYSYVYWMECSFVAGLKICHLKLSLTFASVI